MNEQEIMEFTDSISTEESVLDTATVSEADFPSEEIDETANDNDKEDTAVEDVIEEDGEPPLPSREELCTELARLRAELEETKALHARMASEYDEFHALFPEVNANEIPDGIWEQVKNGVPLAASYALYEKKCALRRQHAEEINLHNAKHTPGAAGKNTPAEYFSPDEVRRMSQSEVRSNYQKILESMKKWNN